MRKILSTEQTKELDAVTIRQGAMASIDLMEKACDAFLQWFVARFDASKKIGIICGTGNNGGDGLGIARLLAVRGYEVSIWIVRGSSKESSDFSINLSRLEKSIVISDFKSSAPFSGQDIIIDALFGSGLNKPAEGIFAEAIEQINASKAVRVSVDIPSGLFVDKHSSGAIVKADFTVAFQLPKLAFMFPENYPYVGAWETVDIGLRESFINELATRHFYLTRDALKKIVKRRSTFSNKGNYGRALIIAGSYGKMGACILAGRAALRAGVGLLTLHVPTVGYAIVQSSVPEAMVSVDTNDQVFSEVPSLESFDVIGIGPGLGQAKETVHAFEVALSNSKPMVIDADALNILSAHQNLFSLIPAGSILTPHPKEFERLVGSWSDDFERLEKQLQLAKRIKSVVILKGAHTSIATPEGEVYFNSTGNPGMATGGTGDVLTGIITAFLGQKYSASEAVILGVYLHGLSGDFAAQKKGMNSLIASDVVDHLPNAFNDLLH